MTNLGVTTNMDRFLRDQLIERRHKLERASGDAHQRNRFQVLLDEVDSALARIDDGCYGICESCHEPIESDRLMADPLARFCLDHLTAPERSALEQDLQLAKRVQLGLLPKQHLACGGWQICYHYDPAGLVSGDYCDVIDAGRDGVYFMVGDVSGKGVAASMLMAHLHAMFRALIPGGLPLPAILEHANSVFLESTLPNQYATLVAGRARPDGTVEICNAGHPSPLVVRGEAVSTLTHSDLPIGLFSNDSFTLSELSFESGDGLVIYSDGVSEATDQAGNEYGADRLRALIGREKRGNAAAMLAACRDDLGEFRRNAAKADDVTLFVLSRG